MLDEDVAVAQPDEQPEPAPVRRGDLEARRRTVALIFRAATLAIFIVVFFAAVIGNWQRAQNVDPLYAYDMVLRTMHFGGTYYQNAINDWGPGEPFLYEVAARTLSRDAFWYGISFFIACFGAILGYAAARTAQFFGANRDLALAVGFVVFFHFTLSPSDYAGVLYVRNITTALLAVTWIIMLWDWAWSTKRNAFIAAIVCGAALGIAVQNLVTTAFAATAVSLTTLALVRLRRPKVEYMRVDTAFVASGAVAFFSAPVWYALRGSFNEFFSGWWTYAQYMSTGTGRSLASQFALGWDQFYSYYQHRPLAAVAILAFLGMAFIDWPSATSRERFVSLGLIGWFLAAWLELILSQRYSSQYFVVSSVPVAFMVAALAGRGYRALTAARGPIRWTYAWPLIALVLVVYLSGAARFTQSVQDLSSFTSVKAHAQAREQTITGDQRSTRAVFDLVSKKWDPILMWTNDPWPYLDYQRISATRFIWKAFLTGEIYLGRTSPSYVLPHSWDWFRKDLKQSNPAAYIKSNGGDIPPDSPFMQVITNDFTDVYPDDALSVKYRNDVADAVLNARPTNPWNAPYPPARADTGWKYGSGFASYREAGGRDVDLLPIAADSCYVLTGNVKSDGPPGGVAFWFSDNKNGKTEALNVDWDGDHVSSGSASAEYKRIPSDLSVSGQVNTPFTLIVGRRAAGLVVNGKLRAAVSLPSSVTTKLMSQRGILDVTGMKVGPAPSFTGC